jgi:hypothetical protein
METGIGLKRARHMPRNENAKILNIYKGIDVSSQNLSDSNVWKEVLNFVVSVS